MERITTKRDWDMKAVCINNISETGKVMSFTVGKVYDVEHAHHRMEDDNYYVHANDNGVNMFCGKKWFKLLSEIRDEKLESIGI